MGERITIETPDGAFGAYVARPSAAKAPAVVVIQEIFGVNAAMRAIVDDYAAEGYLAICPDLFWRIEPGVDIGDKSEAEWKKAFELYNAFDVDLGVKDIAAAVAHAREDGGCAGKVGAVGFCLGGLLAFLTATRTDVEAAVGYYGVGIEKHLGEADKLADPLLLHIAEADEFVPKEARALIVSALKNHPQVEIFTYPDRNHAFARPGGEHFDAADAARAKARTLAHFSKALG
ncbi:MAG: dienelactone hydrolase family protein [Caulobacteraceae bacterium]